MRKIIFTNGECYHVFNRGVDKRDIFMNDNDYSRFLKNMVDFNNNLTREERLIIHNSKKSELSSEGSLVDIISYCLNPNHYHFILKQTFDRGIEKFMHKISTGYTNYFNKKYERSGSLFQGRFKAVLIDSNEQLLHLSSYVNMNHFIHGYENKNKNKKWGYCSVPEYIGECKGAICNKEIILNQFGSIDSYKDFLKNNSQYFKNKKELEKCYFE